MVELHNDIEEFNQCLGRSWGMIIHNTRFFKSNWLHGVIIQFHSFIYLRFIPDFFKTVGNFPKVSNLNALYSKLHRFICN